MAADSAGGVGVGSWMAGVFQGVKGKSSVFVPLLTLNAIVWAALGVSTLHGPPGVFHGCFLAVGSLLLCATLLTYWYVLRKMPDLLRSDDYQALGLMAQLQKNVGLVASPSGQAGVSPGESGVQGKS